MIIALQLVLLLVLLCTAIWVGDKLASGIEGALGEKPLRDRDA